MATHTVYFYENDAFLIDNLSRFIKSGLERQETVIVVATEEHRSDLQTRLMANVSGLVSPTDARYLTFDATATLALFMHEGWPDERLFLKVIGQIVTSSTQRSPLRIYGEMVAVLWAQGKHRAAIRLEELWNALGRLQDFSLLCGYPASVFAQPNNFSALEKVCACHSQVTGHRSWGSG